MGGLHVAFAGLMPHPPIVVPEVAGARLGDCRRTHDACVAFAERLVARAPERLVLVSPHSPRRRGAFGIWSGARLAGDLGRFGAPAAAANLANDRECTARLAAESERAGCATWSIPEQPLDHGAMVPLSFLVRAGFRGPAAIVSLPADPQPAALHAFGAALARALAGLGPAALVASGDMTHRALPCAPSGFHPDAVRFDAALAELVGEGRFAEIAAIDRDLRELAAEDAADSTMLVAAALGFRPRGAEVLSYEHPFGVGYMVAVLHDQDQAEGEPGLGALLEVAREAVRARLEGRAPIGLPRPAGPLRRRAPVFVTLRQREDGELRGCIGSLQPLTDDLVAEVADRAVAAAFDDSRFPPLAPGELERIEIEISVLSPAEPVASPAELDPARFGVIVSDAIGRRGVLLPGIDGIHDAARQVAVARRKAGIPDGVQLRLARFTVERIGGRRGS
jgi:AmmeMemoRadiSam system protein A